MNLLAIDCSANLCAACVWDIDAGRERGRAVLDLGKGHAEHLMSVVGEALEKAGTAYDGLSRIVVSTGPGSFTGVRVGVAAARGLALALKVPAVGVTTLEALAAQAREAFPAQPVLAVLDAGRGEFHAALYDGLGVSTYGPAVTTLEEAAGTADRTGAVLAGTAAVAVAALLGRPATFGPLAATADIAVYARIGAARLPGARPSPVYLREADAKPQAGFVLPRTRS